MKAILLDESKKWLEENCENQYTRMTVFRIIQSMPTVDYQKTPNEPLTCTGCMYAPDCPSEIHCCGCARMYVDHYRRSPEGEETHHG